MPSPGQDLTNPEAVKKAAEKKVFLAIIGYIGVPVLVILLIVSLAILAIFIVTESEKDTNKNICVAWPLESIDKKAIEILNDKCYKKSLISAEEQTNVPWQIIAAVDYASWRQGRRDDRETQHNGDDIPITNETALIEIGSNIQEANIKRNPDGSPSLDIDGLNQETIFPSMITLRPNKAESVEKNISMNRVMGVLTRYRCWSLLRQDMDPGNSTEKEKEFNNTFKDFCYLDQEYKGKRFSDFIKKDPWLWSGVTRTIGGVREAILDKSKREYGAVAFYKYLVDGNACGAGGAFGIGAPGERDGMGFPVLPNYKQCALSGGDGDPSTWNSEGYKVWGGESVCLSGCGLVSATMVLNWYGCRIDPLEMLNRLNSGSYSSSAGGGEAVMGEMANACGMCVQRLGDQQAIENFLSSTHEPMVANVMGTMDRHYLGGHYVAVAGFDGQNYYVNDPGDRSHMIAVPADSFRSYMDQNTAKQNVMFYKPTEGGCK